MRKPSAKTWCFMFSFIPRTGKEQPVLMKQKNVKGRKTGRAEVAFFLTRFAAVEPFSYSLGVSYMSAYLMKKGVSVAIFPSSPSSLPFLIDEIKKSRPRILGLPLLDFTYYQVKIVAMEARRAMPDLLIVAGGPTATFADEKILKDTREIDLIVRGEGEEAIYELLQYTDGKRDLPEIKGITFRDGERIVRTPDRPLIGYGGPRGAELDILPSPYEAGLLTGHEVGPGLQGSRGCVFKCAFCGAPVMFRGVVRYHSVERIISDLKIISENLGDLAKICRVDFWDENFCLSKKRVRKICEAIIKEKLELNIHIEARAEQLDKDLLPLMREAGIREANFGLESAVPHVLRNIKKVGGKSPDFREEKKYIESVRLAVENCKKNDITPTVSVMYGLPGETLEDGLKTVKMVRNLKVPLHYSAFLMIFTGTELYRHPERFGIKVWEGKHNLFPLKYEYPYDITKIPLLPNSFLHRFLYNILRYFENVLFEWWGDFPFNYPTPKPFLFLEDIHYIDDDILEWMKGILNINSLVTVLYNNTRPRKQALESMRRKLRNNILLRPFLIRERSFARFKDGVYYYRMKTSHKLRDLYPEYKLYPFRDANTCRISGDIKRGVFYHVESREDAKTFLALLKERPVDIDNTIAGKMIRQNILLSSACRFRGIPCPARSLTKIIVRSDREIITCANGKPLGRAGESLDDIQDRINEMIKEEEKKRGCSTCPAKDRCARCLYPAPFTREEYCEFVRNTPWLPWILNLVDSIHLQKVRDELSRPLYYRERSDKAQLSER